MWMKRRTRWTAGALSLLSACTLYGCTGEMTWEGKGGDLEEPPLVEDDPSVPIDPPNELPVGPSTGPPRIVRLDESGEDLRGASRPSAEYLIFGHDLPSQRAVPGLDEVSHALTTDADMEPLRDALQAAGWDEEEAAQLTWSGAHHNAWSRLDSLSHRHESLQRAIQESIGLFNTQLEIYEKTHNILVDRGELERAGVPIRLYAEQVQP